MSTRLWTATLGAVCIAAGWLCGQRGDEGLVLHAQETPATASATRYDVRQLRLGNGTREMIRFNPVTGESWQLGGEKWKRIAEGVPISPGEFDIHVLEGPERNNWYVFRFDRVTGKGWNLTNLKWSDAWLDAE